jgi:hypothetical protein
MLSNSPVTLPFDAILFRYCERRKINHKKKLYNYSCTEHKTNVSFVSSYCPLSLLRRWANLVRTTFAIMSSFFCIPRWQNWVGGESTITPAVSGSITPATWLDRGLGCRIVWLTVQYYLSLSRNHPHFTKIWQQINMKLLTICSCISHHFLNLSTKTNQTQPGIWNLMA